MREKIDWKFVLTLANTALSVVVLVLVATKL